MTEAQHAATDAAERFVSTPEFERTCALMTWSRLRDYHYRRIKFEDMFGQINIPDEYASDAREYVLAFRRRVFDFVGSAIVADLDAGDRAVVEAEADARVRAEIAARIMDGLRADVARRAREAAREAADQESTPATP